MPSRWAFAPTCQADFLQVKIGERLKVEKASKEKDAEDPDKQDKLRLLELPSGHFDVVALCLMLSYLPEPAMRLETIKRAKRLLTGTG